jgi:hypothetical protein
VILFLVLFEPTCFFFEDELAFLQKEENVRVITFSGETIVLPQLYLLIR